jgi:Lon-like ATP-dependent protease
MHPALRSRIRGYGYEIYMNNNMEDTSENREKIARFVAQEIAKDGKIPPFSKSAVQEIIQEARKRAGTTGKLTLRLRELGGLIRAAGDLSLEKSSQSVEFTQVLQAKKLARTLENQIVDRFIENKKNYEVIITEGKRIGRVNGLAVLGSDSSYSGIVLPIESEVTFGGQKAEIIATGQLGKIAKEAVKNVSAIILKYFGEDIKQKYDIFVQFLQTASSGGVEGDSASIAVAVAIISALKKIPIHQDIALTGSLSVRGDVLAVGGVSAKVEAAIDTGIKKVIIPKANEKDIIIQKERLSKIKIIPVSNILEVLEHAMDWIGKTHILKKIKTFK